MKSKDLADPWLDGKWMPNTKGYLREADICTFITEKKILRQENNKNISLSGDINDELLHVP